MKTRQGEDGLFLAVIAILYVLAFAGLVGYSYGRKQLRAEQRVERLEADLGKLRPGEPPSWEELQERQRAQFRDDVAAGVAVALADAQNFHDLAAGRDLAAARA